MNRFQKTETSIRDFRAELIELLANPRPLSAEEIKSLQLIIANVADLALNLADYMNIGSDPTVAKFFEATVGQPLRSLIVKIDSDGDNRVNVEVQALAHELVTARQTRNYTKYHRACKRVALKYKLSEQALGQKIVDAMPETF